MEHPRVRGMIRCASLLALCAVCATGCQSKDEALMKFWSAGTGANVQLIFYIAIGVSFAVCEIINAGTRRRKCDTRNFNATVWISFPICIGSPLAGALAARFLLAWLNAAGPVMFIVITIVVSIPLCMLGTKWVISYGRRHLDDLSKME